MDDLLKALLDADSRPEKDVTVKRIGKFRVRALDDKEIEKINERATFGKALDKELRTLLLIKEGTPSFDWDNKALLEKYSVTDGLGAIKKGLLPGEKARLVSAILEVSGFDNDDDTFEEIKN